MRFCAQKGGILRGFCAKGGHFARILHGFVTVSQVYGRFHTYVHIQRNVYLERPPRTLSVPPRKHAPSPAPAIPSPILAVVFAGEPHRRPRWPLAKPQLAAAVVRWCRAAAAVAAALGEPMRRDVARRRPRCHPRPPTLGRRWLPSRCCRLCFGRPCLCVCARCVRSCSRP